MTAAEFFRIDPAPADFAQHYADFAAGRAVMLKSCLITRAEVIEMGLIPRPPDESQMSPG